MAHKQGIEDTISHAYEGILSLKDKMTNFGNKLPGGPKKRKEDVPEYLYDPDNPNVPRKNPAYGK